MPAISTMKVITNEGISKIEAGGAVRIPAESLVNPSRIESLVTIGSPKHAVIQTVKKIGEGTLKKHGLFEGTETDVVDRIFEAVSQDKFTFFGKSDLKPDFILTIKGRPFLVYDSIKRAVYYNLEENEPVNAPALQGRCCTIS